MLACRLSHVHLLVLMTLTGLPLYRLALIENSFYHQMTSLRETISYNLQADQDSLRAETIPYYPRVCVWSWTSLLWPHSARNYWRIDCWDVPIHKCSRRVTILRYLPVVPIYPRLAREMWTPLATENHESHILLRHVRTRFWAGILLRATWSFPSWLDYVIMSFNAPPDVHTRRMLR